MRARELAIAVAIGAFGLGACQGRADDGAFGARVRAYLLAHPEVIQEAAQRLQVKMAVDDAAAQRRALTNLPAHRAALERDARDFVANPAGPITVTEFYDYRCPHCENAAPRVIALIKANPDVRFVFKEMPIFGPTSEHAARAAIAVKKANGDYLRFYQTLMATKALDDGAIDRIARAEGARSAGLAPNRSADAQIADVTALFNALALDGTPTFIVGDEIIPGEDMDAVSAAIARLRAGASTRRG
ncbi:MAG TPA: DsbA family protein [Caulobacteraceae bacterium]